MIDTVRIDALTYKVSETKEPIIIDNRETRGKIEYNSAEIVISDREETCSNDRKAAVLMHEIVHGIIYERGLMSQVDDSEMLCDEFSSAFIGLIRDNPKLIDFIKGGR